MVHPTKDAPALGAYLASEERDAHRASLHLAWPAGRPGQASSRQAEAHDVEVICRRAEEYAAGEGCEEAGAIILRGLA
jgi:hypothetical protein